jgi:hypothetical protein
MARVAKSETNVAGVYGFLERRERDEAERWELGQRKRMQNGYVLGNYPRQRRLDAFNAGMPVNVHSGDILGWNAVHDGAPVVSRPVGHQPERAIVTAADVITWSDDDVATLFLEEHDLL